MVCDTQCESFSEFALASGEEFSGTNISVGRAIEIIEGELDDLRPIHVLVRRLCKITALSDDWGASADSLVGSTIRGSFSDGFIAASESLTLIASCISTCETDCQTCAESTCEDYPYRGTHWKYKVYPAGPVPAELAAFYALTIPGGDPGFVIGAAPVDDYYKFSFDESDFVDGVAPFLDPVDPEVGINTKAFLPHTEIVLRRIIRIPPFVTGATVVVGCKVNDIAEVWWNEVMISPGGIGRTADGTPAGRWPAGSAPQIIDTAEFGGSYVPPNGTDFWFVTVPTSALRIGGNLIAVRAADHFGNLNNISIRVNVDCGFSARSSIEKFGPVEYTF